MKSAMEMSKAIRAKKKMKVVEPENVLEKHMKDPIDELVDGYDDATEEMDENHPTDSDMQNSEEVKYPENDALEMDMKRKKKERIMKMMGRMA